MTRKSFTELVANKELFYKKLNIFFLFGENSRVKKLLDFTVLTNRCLLNPDLL